MKSSCRHHLARLSERIGHLGNAESIFSRGFRGNALQILTAILDFRSEMPDGQCFEALETTRSEFWSTDQAKEESLNGFLNNLELNHTRHLQCKILSKGYAGYQLPGRGDNIVSVAPFDPLQQRHATAAWTDTIRQNRHVAHLIANDRH